MPYPDYTRRERFNFFLSDLGMYMPMIIELTLSYAVAISAVVLGVYDFIPQWLASPVALGGWAYANRVFWWYEAWRASGKRGRIINPWGPQGSDVQTTLLWLTFGVFFHLYHVWLRSGFAIHRRRTKKEQSKI
jgi:hypothetical protein